MNTIDLAMFRITVLNGTERETTITLDRTNILIGRDKTCDLRLRDTYVSRHHCWVEQQEGNWIVRDLGSRNGTWISGRRVGGPVPLDAGTVLKVGRTLIRVEDTAASEESYTNPPWPALTLDFRHKTAQLDDEPVLPPLTDSQWHALVLLCEHRGSVVTYEAIAERVWPDLPQEEIRRHVDRLIERIRMRIGDVEAVLVRPCEGGYMVPALRG